MFPKTRGLIFALIMPLLTFAVTDLAAKQFVITTTSDTGAGSLREAMSTAFNQSDVTHTITFDLPGPGPHEIVLASALPDVLENLSIVNDRAGDESVTIRRSPAAGTPEFSIFRIVSRQRGYVVVLAGLTIAGGKAPSGDHYNRGGGIHDEEVALIVRNCTLTGNIATDTGGALYHVGSPDSATLSVIKSTFSGNSARSGGGAVVIQGGKNVQLVDCMFTGNFNTSGGGGAMSIAPYSAWEPDRTTTTTVTNCTFEDNDARYPDPNTVALGGAIRNNRGSILALTDCTFRRNTAIWGGALSNEGGLTVSTCTFSGNSSKAGGAFFNLEEMTVERSTFAGNSAPDGVGGAIYNVGGSINPLLLRNCTLNGNTALHEGGAIFNDTGGMGGARLRLENCTLSGSPGGTQSSEIWNNGTGSEIQAVNTIFFRAPGSENLQNLGEAVFTSVGHNLSNDAAGGDGGTGPGGLLNGPGDIRNTDPMLAALASNGGPTQTQALLAGSPAIDAADDSLAPGRDQRGYARKGSADIGAYEFEGSIPVNLANISTRLGVRSGDNALFGGFIVTGTQPKKVILRAIGPSLSLPNKLGNPIMELYSGQTLLASNDNWGDSTDKQAIIDSGVAPSNTLESAIIATLPAQGSSYTAVVRGVGGASGIGVVEIYDLDVSVNSKLANISTRGFVDRGDNVLIAGTIVLGEAPQKAIIRAIGPSLNIAGNLMDPTLQLVNANGTQLAFNDNWRTGGQEAEIIATSIAPSNEAESAIVYELPGNGATYTAIVRGFGDTTGIAVVEIYALN
jgi:hypothetical protein